MKRVIWTNSPGRYYVSPFSYLITRFGAISSLLVFTSILFILVYPILTIWGLLILYFILVMAVNIFFMRSTLFRSSSILTIWEDQAFILISDENVGWLTIPRDRFNVDVMWYISEPDPEAPANPPEIVLTDIYKNKIIFPFKLDLTMKLKHDGTVSKILVREKDIKKLVEILKPKRFFNTPGWLVEGYAYVKANFGSELKNLAERMLDLKPNHLIGDDLGDISLKKALVYYLNETLVALAIFNLKNETEKFMKYCLNGRIKDIARRIDLNVIEKWIDNSYIINRISNIVGILGNSLFIIAIILALTYLYQIIEISTAMFLTIEFYIITLLISVHVALTARMLFLGYMGIVGHTNPTFFRGIYIGIITDILLGALHASIPFIGIYLNGNLVNLPPLVLYVYLIYSFVSSLIVIYSNIAFTGYRKYKKLIKEWMRISEI